MHCDALLVFQRFIWVVNEGRIFYPRGLLQAVELHASCLFFASSLQVLFSDRHVDQRTNRNMQEFKHTGVLSHLFLEMRRNAEKLWSLKKKENSHLRHRSSHSIILSPVWLSDCFVVLCLASFWLYLLILVAPGNPTLSCPNQIKTCRGMTPYTVRKTSRIRRRLLEFNLM